MVGQATDVVVTFRRLVDADLPMLHGWINEPGTAPWWPDRERTWDGVVEHYGEQVTDVEQYVIVLDGEPAGWIQTYALADDEAYQAACVGVGVDPAAGGIDYLLGDPAHRGHGIGPAVIDAFVTEVVFAGHDWPQVCAGPDPANRASWRALEKAGFRVAGLIDTDDGPERLMVRDRPPTLRA
jgi:RimJ/RimL family protein N-acetyltransferase